MRPTFWCSLFTPTAVMPSKEDQIFRCRPCWFRGYVKLSLNVLNRVLFWASSTVRLSLGASPRPWLVHISRCIEKKWVGLELRYRDIKMPTSGHCLWRTICAITRSPFHKHPCGKGHWFNFGNFNSRCTLPNWSKYASQFIDSSWHPHDGRPDHVSFTSHRDGFQRSHGIDGALQKLARLEKGIRLKWKWNYKRSESIEI